MWVWLWGWKTHRKTVANRFWNVWISHQAQCGFNRTKMGMKLQQKWVCLSDGNHNNKDVGWYRHTMDEFVRSAYMVLICLNGFQWFSYVFTAFTSQLVVLSVHLLIEMNHQAIRPIRALLSQQKPSWFLTNRCNIPTESTRTLQQIIYSWIQDNTTTHPWFPNFRHIPGFPTVVSSDFLDMDRYQRPVAKC
jgi:hypothetical protein